jgi:hypothetical protein
MRAAALNRTPETLFNLSVAHMGKKHTPETLAKMSAAHRSENLPADVRAIVRAVAAEHNFGRQNKKTRRG